VGHVGIGGEGQEVPGLLESPAEVVIISKEQVIELLVQVSDLIKERAPKQCAEEGKHPSDDESGWIP